MRSFSIRNCRPLNPSRVCRIGNVDRQARHQDHRQDQRQRGRYHHEVKKAGQDAPAAARATRPQPQPDLAADIPTPQTGCTNAWQSGQQHDLVIAAQEAQRPAIAPIRSRDKRQPLGPRPAA